MTRSLLSLDRERIASTMNRRSLLTVVSSLFPHHPAVDTPPPVLTSDVLAGRAFAATARAGTGLRYLTVIVRRAPSVLAAERTRLALLGQAGDIERGTEYHATHVIGQPLPDHLALRPGSLVSWDTVARAGAVRTSWAAGYFRRHDLTWEIIATGTRLTDLARLVIDLADDLTAREITAPGQDWTGSLWTLLPTEADLPASMRLDTVFANDRIHDLAAARTAA